MATVGFCSPTTMTEKRYLCFCTKHLITAWNGNQRWEGFGQFQQQLDSLQKTQYVVSNILLIVQFGEWIGLVSGFILNILF